MGNLQYSIFRYAPSLVSGEKINIAAVFHYEQTGYRELFTVSKWQRISGFDDTLNIPLLKSLMLDIKDEIGTQIDNPNFNLRKFCLKYDSEFYFDKCETLVDVLPEDVDKQIEEVKKMYFQFEFDVVERPTNEDQKKYLRHLLKAKDVDYQRNAPKIGKYNAEIKYDYLFGRYGVAFFDFNGAKIDHKVLNRVKAWAWNAQNAPDDVQLVVLYDLGDKDRTEVKAAIDILSEAAYKIINIHDGFSDVSSLLDREIS